MLVLGHIPLQDDPHSLDLAGGVVLGDFGNAEEHRSEGFGDVREPLGLFGLRLDLASRCIEGPKMELHYRFVLLGEQREHPAILDVRVVVLQ